MNGSSSHTPTALQRWSCIETRLPPVKRIRRIHIYDFDNTLFSSPLPNKQLWNSSTIGALQSQEFLYNGGWWHNPRILSATGQGIEKEEQRGWEGCWNENIAELARMSAEDDEALSILLTGRGEANFSGLLARIVKSKGLHFDIVALKPKTSPYGQRFSSTLQYKTTFLEDLMLTYNQATEIRMYEDRPKHTQAFQEFFDEKVARLTVNNMNSANAQYQPQIDAKVIQVSEEDKLMEPVSEVAEVQRMVNDHNQAILDGDAPPDSTSYKLNRHVFYTGYIISASDSARLRSLMVLPPGAAPNEFKLLANNILIAPRPAAPHILNKVGGMGAKMRWKVTGMGQLENRVFAIRVAPTISGAKIWTENHTPYVLLALKRPSKPIEATRIRQWQPLPEHLIFEFDTTVGEKVVLSIETESKDDADYDPSSVELQSKQRTFQDEDFPALGAAQPDNRPTGPRAQQNGGSRSNRGGASSYRGGYASVNRRERASGRGGRRPYPRDRQASHGGHKGRGAYRSLDASVDQSYGASGMEY